MYTQQPLFDEFKKAAGDYAALYTSKVEVSYSPYFYINHPYWDTDEFQEGAVCYDGIVSLITHKGSLPGSRLDENSQLFAYEFPQNKPAFEAPAYDSEEQMKSRVPDFRHTLYWNPEITPATDVVSFYTSDMKGRYVVTLQGITATGEAVRTQCEFVVQ